jgi:hypothetical protein
MYGLAGIPDLQCSSQILLQLNQLAEKHLVAVQGEVGVAHERTGASLVGPALPSCHSGWKDHDRQQREPSTGGPS